MHSPPDEVPTLARPFVAGLVGLMIAAAVFVGEPWPLSSFRLFSHARSDTQVSWSAEAVTRSGERLKYPIPGLQFTMPGFIADPAERDADCRDWIDAAPSLIGETVESVTVSEVRVVLTDREGDRAAAGETAVRARCGQGGGEVVG